MKDGRPFSGEDLHHPQEIAFSCQRCKHEWLETCSIDGGPSPAWQPHREPLTCPNCNLSPYMTFEERHPGRAKPKTLTEWWAIAVEDAFRKAMLEG